MDLLQMLQDDEITVTGRANSMPLFFLCCTFFFFKTLPYFINLHMLLCLCACISLCICKCVSAFVPGHPKPSDFMDNKAERRVIDTRAANCCRDTKRT